MNHESLNENQMAGVAAAAAAITSGPPRFTRAQIKTLRAGYPALEWRSAAQRAEDLGVTLEQLLNLEAADRDPRAHDSTVTFDPRSGAQTFGVKG
jgi:hypothetical protein